MTERKLLVVSKKTRYQEMILEREDEHVAELIALGDVSVRRWVRAHEAHERSLDRVCETLTARGVAFDVRTRDELGEAVDAWSLVITVGGDGTVLDLSHRVRQTPVLAINSDPATSIGYFCAGSAEEFGALLDHTLQGQWRPRELARFVVEINEDVRTPPVLNDILIAHANPAAVSSYLLRVGEHEEAQRSSGIWIATPAGSTAAIRSAGGYVISIDSRSIQYLVREPYPPREGGYRLTKGLRPHDTAIELISKMSQGRVYVDGPHICYPFTIGDRLRIDGRAPALRLYGLDESQRTG